MGSQSPNEPDPPRNEEAINQTLFIRLITHKSHQSLNWDGF
jgi:hypothetical protein